MNKKRAILWFRHDLRWHDNEAIQEVSRSAEEIIPVYIFDERLIYGWQKGPYPKIFRTRLQFVIESVQNLRNTLREKGSDLFVRVGKPEEIIYKLARDYGAAGVFCNRERMPREGRVQDNLEAKLWTLGQELFSFRGKMLFYSADLPFPVARMPELFSTFRKEMEQIVAVRDVIDMTEVELPLPDTDLDPGDIPSLEDFGYDPGYQNPIFKGGETVGVKWIEERLKDIREGKGGSLMSSPWLSSGNISPKWLYHKVSALPDSFENIKNQLRRNLMLRDYYWLLGRRSPEAMFRPGGFKNDLTGIGSWDEEEVLTWIKGETGIDLIDAAMRCFFYTGYLDHQMKKAVARYLLEEMNVHWQLGAGYFESVSLDYDPSSNYGNWQRQAGIGADLKSRHAFNLENLADQIDPDGSFRDHWIDREIDYDFECRKLQNPMEVS